MALGANGARLMAAGIAVSNRRVPESGHAHAPRVYYAMARDGLFFKRVGSLNERSRAPVVAIALQGVWASVIVLVLRRLRSGAQLCRVAGRRVFGLTGAALLVSASATRLR